MSAPPDPVRHHADPDAVSHRPHPAAFWVKHAAIPLAVLAALLPQAWLGVPHLLAFLAVLGVNIALTLVSTLTGEPDAIARLFPQPASGRNWATRAQIGERLGGPGSPVRAERLRVLALAFALMLGGTALAALALDGEALGRALLLGFAALDLWHADRQRRLADRAAGISPALARLIA